MDWRRDRYEEAGLLSTRNIHSCFQVKGTRDQAWVCSVHCVWQVTWRVHHLLLDQNTWYTRSENKSTQCGVLYFALSIKLALLSVGRRTLRRFHLDARARHYSFFVYFYYGRAKNYRDPARKEGHLLSRINIIVSKIFLRPIPCNLPSSKCIRFFTNIYLLITE